MHKLLTTMSLREFFLGQLPAMILSLAIAEQFYKFHSFTLECLAFLATWYAADFLIGRLHRAVSGRSGSDGS